MSKILKISLTSLCIMITSAVIFSFFPMHGYGHLHIRVVDAYTLKPLRGTSVTIADTDTTLVADSTGSCIFTGIPIRHNPLLNRLVPIPYGECTVIAVLAGYRPSVILHAEVEKGRMRNGPTVYMFPEDTDDIPAAVITETPNEQWISQLIENYCG